MKVVLRHSHSEPETLVKLVKQGQNQAREDEPRATRWLTEKRRRRPLCKPKASIFVNEKLKKIVFLEVLNFFVGEDRMLHLGNSVHIRIL